MGAKYRSTGDRIDYTPLRGNVTAGDVVVQGTLVGVATDDIAVNRKGSLAVEGVFDFDKDDEDFDAGEDVYYDGAEATDNPIDAYVGKAVEEAGEDDATVRVKLIQITPAPAEESTPEATPEAT